MTANPKLAPMLSHNSDEWATPQDFFSVLDDEFHFDLDAAATNENAKCSRYFGADNDGLSQNWVGTVWCNPPYSQLAKWIAKAAESARAGATVVLLIPARTDTRAWHKYVWDGENHQPRPGVQVRLVKGRLKFGGAENNAPFPNAVVVFRPPAINNV